MAENKTRPTKASVADYLRSRASPRQRTDCRELMALFRKVTGKPPRMWGPSIVGYGSYTYAYASGRTGIMPLAAFAIRGGELVVYLSPEVAKRKALLRKLGNHRVTKCCLYIKRLADLDLSVLEKLIVDSMPEVRRNFA